MKFLIEGGNNVPAKELTYLGDEFSFYMESFESDYDLELALNKLTLSLIDNKVVQITGFCGLAISMNSNICVPEYSKGFLRVEHDLKNGFVYGIYDEDQPVHLNTKSGWVCIGDPLKIGSAVEFIKNCVAVVSDNGDLLSLWLKPKSLPKFEESN